MRRPFIFAIHFAHRGENAQLYERGIQARFVPKKIIQPTREDFRAAAIKPQSLRAVINGGSVAASVVNFFRLVIQLLPVDWWEAIPGFGMNILRERRGGWR